MLTTTVKEDPSRVDELAKAKTTIVELRAELTQVRQELRQVRDNERELLDLVHSLENPDDD